MEWYICKEEFSLPSLSLGGDTYERMVIPERTVWVREKDPPAFTTGANSIRLRGLGTMRQTWLELTPQDIECYFDEIEPFDGLVEKR